VSVFEIAILSALILATRCANYQDVFVAGNVYFVDADCYARMTRVQMVNANPGLIVRHHAFENFPQGTTPHTTALLDYLILGLSLLLTPFSTHALDLAGAFISPVLALLGGLVLWWWSRRMKFRYRWIMLILYAISPIVVHGTELGRPDHQSLSMLLVVTAICAEWSIAEAADPSGVMQRRRWSVVSGAAWGFAIWNSAYESLILFLLLTVVLLVLRDRTDGAPSPRRGNYGPSLLIYVLLIATYFLTIWQARWGYFFVLIFAIALPDLLEPIKLRSAVWIAFVLSMFPILGDWDERL